MLDTSEITNYYKIMSIILDLSKTSNYYQNML